MKNRPSPSRKSQGSRRSHSFRPQYEELENRLTPASLTYDVPVDSAAHALTVRLNAGSNRFEILDNGALVASRNTSNTFNIEINGADFQNEALTVEIPSGMALPPVAFNAGFFDTDRISVSANLSFSLDDFNLFASDGTNISLSGVEDASLTGGAGDNLMDASFFNGNTTLIGGAGNDTLTGGFGVDSMLGGAGNDRMQSLNGRDDQLQGGADNDYYLIRPGSNPVVTDDGGNDVIDLSQITRSGVQVTLNATSGSVNEILNPDSRVTINGQFETLIATALDDFITASNDTLRSLSQTFIGGAGNDTFTDLSTAEVLTFYGDTDPDFPIPEISGIGDDTYILIPGSTIVVSDDGGTDTFDFSRYTSGGATVTLGESSAAVSMLTGNVVGTGKFENVIGTNGDDRIVGNSADNRFFGGLGLDYLDGGLGFDFLDGGGNEDTIIGGEGSDSLMGGGGNDYFDGGMGSDMYTVIPNSSFIFTDSGGIDTLDFSQAKRGISISLGSTGTQSIDAAKNKIQLIGTFENVIGTPYDDQITGNSADNLLVGGGGNDVLNGQAGRDILIGGNGADRLNGSSGEDILIGGFTDFDNNLTALLAIQAEWSSSRDYLTRVNNIRGVSNVGPRLNGDYFLKASGTGQTARNDGQVDTLTGSQQNDWFFLFTGDVVTDTNKGEEIN